MAGVLRAVARPKALLSLALGGAVLAALLAFGDVARIMAAAARLPPGTLLAFFACMAALELVRGAQWLFLLRALRVRTPLRTRVLAFGLGEVLKDMPVGAFLPAYFLRESRGAAFGRSSAATFVVLGSEVVVGLALAAAFGLGAWTWVRPVALAGIVVTVLLAAGARHYLRASTVRTWLPRWLTRRDSVQRTLDGMDKLRHGLVKLLRLDVLGVSLLAAVACELLAAGALLILMRGIGEADLPFRQTLTAHGFSVALALSLPLPIDFGALEVSGVAALLAVGLPKHAAVAAMVLNRAFSLAFALLLSLGLVAAFPAELRRAWESRRKAPSAGNGRQDNDRGAPAARHEPERRAA